MSRRLDHLREGASLADGGGGPEPPPPSLNRTLRSFRFAWQGLVHIAHSQPNWRIHMLAAISAIGLGAALRVTPVELALLLLTSGFVLGLEAVNTAIEAAVDAQSGPPSLPAKRAKDAAAAAVLIGAITAVAVGVCVLLPPLVMLASRL